MTFHSLQFLIFFPVVVAVFFSLPQRARSFFLLAASYYFYMAWEPAYGLLLLLSTAIDYAAGRAIGATYSKRRKKLFLGVSLLANLGILFFFKYFNFFFDSFAAVINVFGIDFDSPALSVLLPVGISFYTFQSLSYTIDVYRGKRPPEKNFWLFALYLSFFPQLVAGPIETSTRLLPQLGVHTTPDPARFTSGLRLMLWGFFKKVVIADNAGRIVDAVYADPTGVNGIALAAATFFFAIQIYADFSGYTDIARGAARIMGYDLMLNFNRPYFSVSIAEFWRRWHISLMHWFKEYIYIPLGGSRQGSGVWARNMVLVFLISGMWHGANWTFVVWGLLNACYVIVSKYTEGERAYIARVVGLTHVPALHTTLRIIMTGILTMIAWIFFRAQSLGHASTILLRIIGEIRTLICEPTLLPTRLLEAGYALALSKTEFVFLMGAILLLFSVEFLIERRGSLAFFLRLPRSVRLAAYYALLIIIIAAGYFGKTTFIYFQF